LTFVLDKVVQRGAQAEEDDGEKQEDDNSHVEFPGKKFSLDDSLLRCQSNCLMVLNSNPGCGPASQPAWCCY
jgi:hypothetical protein